MTHRHPSCSFRGHGFLGTLLASATLSAAITYLLFGAQPSNARANLPRRHDAVTQDVSVDAQLVKTEHGWSVELRATSAAAMERRCNIVTSLTRLQSSTMSRVPPTPRVVWTGTVAVTVPAKGESPERLLIPASVAKAIPDPTAGPSLPGMRDHYGVRVQATCGGGKGDRVS